MSSENDDKIEPGEIVYKHIYEYNGVYYSVTESSDVHEQLQKDSDYFIEYIGNHTNEPKSTADEEETQHRWSQRATKFLLDMIMKRYKDFRDPEKKRKILWLEIKKEFEEHGFGNFSEETLDRKMRNLKRRYRAAIERDKKNPDTPKWEHFHYLEMIFGNDLFKRFNGEGPPVKRRRFSPSPLENPSSPTSDDNTPLSAFWSSPVVKTENLDNDITFSSPQRHPKEAAVENELNSTNENWVNIQERQLEVLNRISQSMQENNMIQRERNKILKDLLVNFDIMKKKDIIGMLQTEE